VVRTTSGEIAHRWTAGRSPVLRILLVPLVIIAVLVLLLVAALAVALALVGAVLAVVAVTVLSLPWLLAEHRTMPRSRRVAEDTSDAGVLSPNKSRRLSSSLNDEP
jgi:Flp pilus assembly protein TadB